MIYAKADSAKNDFNQQSQVKKFKVTRNDGLFLDSNDSEGFEIDMNDSFDEYDSYLKDDLNQKKKVSYNNEGNRKFNSDEINEKDWALKKEKTLLNGLI